MAVYSSVKVFFALLRMLDRIQRPVADDGTAITTDNPLYDSIIDAVGII